MRFYKLQNGNKYDLTAVATSLYDLIGEDLPEYLNYVVLQNTGGSDVRYLLNGNTPDDTNGFVLKTGETVNYSLVNLRRLSMLSPGGAGSVQVMVGESSDEAGFDFQSYSTGGGGGGAEGALLIANNLSDITNDALARTNIGAGTGDGDLLSTNNLSDVSDPAVARTNIGAGTGDGDLLAANNLSDLADTSTAKQNLGVDFYPNGEVLKFGGGAADPNLKIGTVANPDGSQVQRIEYKNLEDGVLNHLQIGPNNATFSNFNPVYTTNQFPDTPGVLLRSNLENVNLGLFPRLSNTNLSFMITGPGGLRMVADTAGGPGVLQLGQGGSSGVLNLSGNSSTNNRVVSSNGTGHSLYLNRSQGSAIIRPSDGARSTRPFFTSVGHVVPNTIIANSDYEVNSEDYLVSYVQCDGPFIVQIPKLSELLGTTSAGQSLSERTFIFVIKDASGSCSAQNTITITSIENLPFDNQANYVMDRPYGAVTLMVCAVNGVEKILIINEY